MPRHGRRTDRFHGGNFSHEFSGIFVSSLSVPVEQNGIGVQVHKLCGKSCKSQGGLLHFSFSFVRGFLYHARGLDLFVEQFGIDFFQSGVFVIERGPPELSLGRTGLVLLQQAAEFGIDIDIGIDIGIGADARQKVLLPAVAVSARKSNRNRHGSIGLFVGIVFVFVRSIQGQEGIELIAGKIEIHRVQSLRLRGVARELSIVLLLLLLLQILVAKTNVGRSRESLQVIVLVHRVSEEAGQRGRRILAVEVNRNRGKHGHQNCHEVLFPEGNVALLIDFIVNVVIVIVVFVILLVVGFKGFHWFGFHFSKDFAGFLLHGDSSYNCCCFQQRWCCQQMVKRTVLSVIGDP
mmetsp:Transcript_23240/g.64446  ORF Transcript_23240/g.64446 Transcript_23240/m.64446 type:complete len:349 (+) Transcript_23240:2516-3562(+)